VHARMPDVPRGRHRHSHSNGTVHAHSVAPSIERQSDFHAADHARSRGTPYASNAASRDTIVYP
jgi:hypothetical protein